MKKTLLALLVLVVVASGCTGSPEAAPDSEPTGDSGNGEEATVDAVVNYTSQGFRPATVTIQQGDTVKWINRGGPEMWVASDRHPTHTDYDGTSLRQHCGGGESDTFDQCGTDDTYAFTFQKTGEWDYHNHESAGHTGTVVVQ